MKKLFLILILLAGLVSTGEAQTTNQRRNVPMVTKAFGAITNGFTAFLTNSSGVSYTDIDLINLTDATITCTYDTATDHFPMPAYSTYEIPLAKINAHHAGTIYCKYTSAAPTTGSFYISAGYLQ